MMHRRPNGPQVCVGAVVIHQQAVLLIRRGQAPNKGLWCIPGGGVEPGERLQDALTREVLEETGIQVQPNKLVYHGEIIERDENDGIRFHYVILDYLATYQSGEPNAASDACAAAWVKLNELGSYDCVKDIIDIIKRAASA